MSHSSGAERTAALTTMMRALDAAKDARDSGVDVRRVREILKQSRAAFEAANYFLAAQLADQVLEICGKQSVVSPRGPSRSQVLVRMTEALDATKRAKRSGDDVRRAREVLKQARAAYEAGNYGAAYDLANETLILCGASPNY